MPTCTRRLEFDAGHRVTLHESKCRNVHGHRYAVEVTVHAPSLDTVGRVADFGHVKALVGEWIDRVLDHGYIHHPDDPEGPHLAAQGMKTYSMPWDLGEPTAENIATLIHREAARLLPSPLTVAKVVVYETPNCWAESDTARIV